MSTNLDVFLTEYPDWNRRWISESDGKSVWPATLDLLAFKSRLVEAHIKDLRASDTIVLPDHKKLDLFPFLWGLENEDNIPNANLGWELDGSGELRLIDDLWVPKEFGWAESIDVKHYPLLAALTLTFDDEGYGTMELNKVSPAVRFALEVEADASLLNLLTAERARAAACKAAVKNPSPETEEAAKVARAEMFSALWV